MTHNQKSASPTLAPHNSGERLPSGDTADGEADTEEIARLTALVDRYRSALEIIAGQSQNVLHAMQAKAALNNIGPTVK